jgi:hypothetical protein
VARLKKSSAVLDLARIRLAGLKAINPAPNFGPGLTAAIYEAKVDSTTGKLEAYNQLLSTADQVLNEYNAEEKGLGDLNRRFLSAGEAHFGPDSSEYEMLGGTRTSERKKPTRKGGTGSTGSGTPSH